MTEGSLDEVLRTMWAGFAPLARTRVEAVEAYAVALADGRDDAALRTPAAVAAHKLAGALGSYGRSGSPEAAALEELLLDAETRPDPATVTSLAGALRRAVDA